MRIHITLLCCLTAPHNSFCAALLHTNAILAASNHFRLRFQTAILPGFTIPFNRFLLVRFYAIAFLIATGQFILCLCISILFSCNFISQKSSLLIPRLVKIFCILQVFLYRFLLAFFLCFLPQTMTLHTNHKLSLFVLWSIEQEAVRCVFLAAKIHILDLGTQTTPLYAACSRFKPLFNRLFLDSIGDFHFTLIHTDRIQFICKTHFHLSPVHKHSSFLFFIIPDTASTLISSSFLRIAIFRVITLLFPLPMGIRFYNTRSSFKRSYNKFHVAIPIIKIIRSQYQI